MSWWDLKCIIRHLPRDSALFRVQHPDDWQWDLDAHLLAGLFDLLQGANWQRAGNPRAKRPEPLERPGVKRSGEGRVVKPKKALPMDEVRRRLKVNLRPPEPVQPAPVKRGRGRLSAHDRELIRSRRSAGVSVRELTAEFRVSRSTVYRIVRESAAGGTLRP